MLIKYIKSVLWRVAKRLSYTEDARGLKGNFGWATSDEEYACRTKRRLESAPDTEVVLRKIRCENVNCIELAPGRVRSWKFEESSVL